MVPYARPQIPIDLKAGDDIKRYAVAATRYIIDLQEKIDVDEAKLNAIKEWCEKMEARHGRRPKDE